MSSTSPGFLEWVLATAWIFAPLLGPSAVGAQAAAFSYDARTPIGLVEHGRQIVDGVSVRDISYASPKGGDVPAYLVVPPGEEPFAGVVFLHWGQGDRSEFLSESLLLARTGAVSLLIDAPFNRPGFEPFAYYVEPERERDFYVQLVIDVRRAVDVLTGQAFVDPDRIGYVGHSLGATWGGALAAVEKRIDAFVLMGGLPHVTGRGDTPLWRASTAALTDEQIRRQAEMILPISSASLVGQAAPSRLLFQFARWDRYVSEDAATAYVEAASDPKEARLYFTSHEFNDLDSRRDRLEWLAEQLQLDGSALPR
jgi:dienelactone hydrolase